MRAGPGDAWTAAGIPPNAGLATLLGRLGAVPDRRAAIEAAIAQRLAEGPALAMVDSDHGITNLHVPSDVIIDASMPPMIRDGGKMWGADGKPYDTLAMIPDRCYAGVYAAAVEDCRKNGALDPVTRAELQHEFSELARRLGKTIVIVTHDLREALLLASRIVLLEKGRIVAEAAPRDFLRIEHPEVRAFTASLQTVPGVSA